MGGDIPSVMNFFPYNGWTIRRLILKDSSTKLHGFES